MHMLFAANRASFGERFLNTHLALGNGFRIFSTDRGRLSSDSEHFPATTKEPRNVSQLWFLIEGTLHVSFDAFHFSVVGPSLVLLPEHWGKGSDGKRRIRLRTEGNRFRTVQVHYRGSVTDFGMLPLAAPLLQAVTTYHGAVLAQESAPAAADAVTSFLQALQAATLLPQEISPGDAQTETPASVQRVWHVMREMYRAVDASPSLKVIAAMSGLSRRHTARIISELFRDYLFPPGGLQEIMLMLRLALASMLLTTKEFSVKDVSKRLGYGYPESLSNAFKRANLVPPSRMRDDMQHM